VRDDGRGSLVALPHGRDMGCLVWQSREIKEIFHG
jgi:hypothetical protein